MKIEAFKEYVAISRDQDGKVYRWKLDIKPGNKAWSLVNQVIYSGDTIGDYQILSISNVPERITFDASDVGGFEPLYTRGLNHYSCDICGGDVENDRCTECHFDWDS